MHRSEMERENIKRFADKARDSIEKGDCPINQSVGDVPWAFKCWTQFTDSDKTALQAHVQSMDKHKRQDYRLHMKGLGVPLRIMR